MARDNEYLNNYEYYIDNLWFKHKGLSYRGSGVLRWQSEKGFHLVAKIIKKDIPTKVEFKIIELTKPFRIKIEIDYDWEKVIVITPFLNIRESDIHFSNLLRVNFGRAVFFQGYGNNNKNTQENWVGSATYEINENIILPDSIRKDSKIGEKEFGYSSSRTGFDYVGKNEEKLTGELEDKKYLYFFWSLPKNKWTKENSWGLAESLQDALSIISGSIVKLRFHKAYRNNRIANEYNANGKPTSLGVIFRFFDYDIIPKDLVANLAIYLSHKSENEYIIRKMLSQAIDASSQNSDVGRALLLTTIMEASLRTLYKIPFIANRASRDDPYKPDIILPTFQKEYLSGKHNSSWEKWIEKILEAYKHLRHKNAHPDWVTDEGGMLSNQETEQTLNDMILLSRFYGYMILALSGFKDLEPKFPKPYSDWNPMMTMETIKNPVEEK